MTPKRSATQPLQILSSSTLCCSVWMSVWSSTAEWGQPDRCGLDTLPLVSIDKLSDPRCYSFAAHTAIRALRVGYFSCCCPNMSRFTLVYECINIYEIKQNEMSMHPYTSHMFDLNMIADITKPILEFWVKEQNKAHKVLTVWHTHGHRDNHRMRINKL